MHDLNDALDELRSVIPYAHSPSVRKLSKIATLLLAKNYILMQASALDELKRLVGYHPSSTAALIPPSTTPFSNISPDRLRSTSGTAGIKSTSGLARLTSVKSTAGFAGVQAGQVISGLGEFKSELDGSRGEGRTVTKGEAMIVTGVGL